MSILNHLTPAMSGEKKVKYRILCLKILTGKNPISNATAKDHSIHSNTKNPSHRTGHLINCKE